MDVSVPRRRRPDRRPRLRRRLYPDFFLFDGDRRLVYRGRFDGSTPGNNVPITGDELDAAVKALAGGQPISTDQRPSVGCSIKWKPGNEPS